MSSSSWRTPTTSTSRRPAPSPLLTDAGVEVVYCLVTDGQAGGFDRTIPRTEMAAIRREEQTKAAAEVGVTSLHFLGHMDGSVVVDMQLRHDISRVIRTVRPQVVITQSPLRNLASTYGSHPDHIAAAEATMCAVYPDARNPFAFSGSRVRDLDDWAVDEVWIPNGPDAEDVRRHHRDGRPQDAGAAVPRQPARRSRAACEARVRAWWSSAAEANGLPAGSSCESFRVVDTR